jgi:Fe-S-cluster-containing hydrogenase component 2
LSGSSGKKSKEEQEKAAVEKEALEKITVALEAGASSNTTCQRSTRDCMGACMLTAIILRV